MDSKTKTFLAIASADIVAMNSGARRLPSEILGVLMGFFGCWFLATMVWYSIDDDTGLIWWVVFLFLVILPFWMWSSARAIWHHR